VQDTRTATSVAPPLHDDSLFVSNKNEDPMQLQAPLVQTATQTQAPEASVAAPQHNSPVPAPLPDSQAPSQLPALEDRPLTCLECRQHLREYAEAMDNGQNVETLYPEVYDHLLACESGCLVLLELFRQEAKANRKYRRRPVRNPFSAIGWELTGFFRGGQVTMSPMALSYGTLILLLLVASLATYLSIHWDDARYYHPPIIKYTIPTPDGIGMSDGLNIYDACNASSYQYKREAAMQCSRTTSPARISYWLQQRPRLALIPPAATARRRLFIARIST
jgi:hypothetical protein